MSEHPLQRALELYKSGNPELAQEAILPYTQAQPDDWRGWWLLANVAVQPSQIEAALENVLRLRPDHPKAQAMLNRLRPGALDRQELLFVDPDQPAEEALFEAARKRERPRRKKKMGVDGQAGWLLIALAVGVAFAITGLLVIGQGGISGAAGEGGGDSGSEFAYEGNGGGGGNGEYNEKDLRWVEYTGRGVSISLPANFAPLVNDTRQVSILEMRRLGPEFNALANALAVNNDAVAFAAADRERKSGLFTNMHITRRAPSGDESLGYEMEVSLVELPGTPEVLERSTVTLDHYTAGRLLVKNWLNDIPLLQEVYVVQHEGRVWTLTYTASEGVHEDVAGVFEASARSFRIE
jgi:hypothetical protein